MQKNDGMVMKVNELKKCLNEATKEELSSQILELFKKNEFVKDFYKLKYDASYKTAALEKHKEVIKQEFFPKRGHGKARLSVAKKSITEYKKLSNDKEQIADIMLFYVEMGVAFTSSYGDISGPFYESMESMYENTLKFIVKSKLKSKFNDRCLDIVRKTRGMGWGFNDQLSYYYSEYFAGK